MTIFLWLFLIVVLPVLFFVASKQWDIKPKKARNRATEHEALLLALEDWLGDPFVSQALVHEGFERNFKAIEGCRHSLGDLTYQGLHNLSKRILEHRHVRHLIAKRIMRLSGCSQYEAKTALRELGGIWSD